MTPTLQELKDACASLSAPHRAELAEFLLQSLEPREAGWAEAWQAELTHRLEELRSGRVVGVPADDVINGLRELYK